MSHAETSRLLFLLEALEKARGRTRRALLKLAHDPKASYAYSRAVERLRRATSLPEVTKALRAELW